MKIPKILSYISKTALIAAVLQTNVYAQTPTIQPYLESQDTQLLTDRFNGSSARGYHFKPLKNGHITAFSGQFSGEATVRLFQKSDQTLLAEARVISTGEEFRQVDIEPVPVLAGVEYTVAAYLSPNQAVSYRVPSVQNIYPFISGDVQVTSSTTRSTRRNANAVPVREDFHRRLDGVVDVIFDDDVDSKITACPIITRINYTEFDALDNVPYCITVNGSLMDALVANNVSTEGAQAEQLRRLAQEGYRDGGRYIFGENAHQPERICSRVVRSTTSPSGGTTSRTYTHCVNVFGDYINVMNELGLSTEGTVEEQQNRLVEYADLHGLRTRFYDDIEPPRMECPLVLREDGSAIEYCVSFPRWPDEILSQIGLSTEGTPVEQLQRLAQYGYENNETRVFKNELFSAWSIYPLVDTVDTSFHIDETFPGKVAWTMTFSITTDIADALEDYGLSTEGTQTEQIQRLADFAYPRGIFYP